MSKEKDVMNGLGSLVDLAMQMAQDGYLTTPSQFDEESWRKSKLTEAFGAEPIRYSGFCASEYIESKEEK